MNKLLVTLLIGGMLLLQSCVGEYVLSDPNYHGYYDFRKNVRTQYIVKIHIKQQNKTKVIRKR